MTTKIGFVGCSSTCMIAVIIYSEMIEIAFFIGWKNFQSSKWLTVSKHVIVMMQSW